MVGIEPERGRENRRFPVEENNEYWSVRNRGLYTECLEVYRDGDCRVESGSGTFLVKNDS